MRRDHLTGNLRLDPRDWESFDELEEALEAWRQEYNHQRPHQALAWRTPAEQRALNLGLSLQAAA